MTISDIFNSIEIANPSVTQIHKIITGISKLNPQQQEALIRLLDTGQLTQLALWSAKFVDVVNNVGAPIGPARLKRIISPVISNDFFTVMESVVVDAECISPESLSSINNDMTKAIKAANWAQALQVGISLASALPAV